MVLKVICGKLCVYLSENDSNKRGEAVGAGWGEGGGLE